uniref:Uncharacterized protein n=1 Tax=Anguilla anguilla TaxID=7936 RepID=A0A0E9RD19_ANGAN
MQAIQDKMLTQYADHINTCTFHSYFQLEARTDRYA